MEQKVPSAYAITLANTFAGEASVVTVLYTPLIDLAAGATVDIKIPTSFVFSGTPVCSEKAAGGDGSTTDSACVMSGSTLTVTTATRFLSTGVNYVYLGSLGGGLRNPTLPGAYIFHMSSFLAGEHVFIESFSSEIVVEAVTIPFASMEPIENKAGAMTVMRTSWTTLDVIPEGKVDLSKLGGTHGEIRYRFRTMNGLSPWFKPDLGTGVASGSNMECIAIKGIEPQDSSGLHCMLLHGTGQGNLDFATIVVTNFKPIMLNT
jgi:hypothetical protein